MSPARHDTSDGHVAYNPDQLALTALQEQSNKDEDSSSNGGLTRAPCIGPILQLSVLCWPPQLQQAWYWSKQQDVSGGSP